MRSVLINPPARVPFGVSSSDPKILVTPWYVNGQVLVYAVNTDAVNPVTATLTLSTPVFSDGTAVDFFSRALVNPLATSAFSVTLAAGASATYHVLPSDIVSLESSTADWLLTEGGDQILVE